MMNLPATWFATFWFFYTIYNAFNNPALGYLSDRTHTRWGRRIPYVLFGGLPYAVAFALLFTAPFDGRDNPVGLLLYFGIAIVAWEGLYTALATGYYGLLPEMFDNYCERTDVAAKMNIFQTVALVLGAALPPLLADLLGWSGMATVLAVISVVALYAGYPALFERPELKKDTGFPFGAALKATAVMILGIIPMGFSPNIFFTYLTAVIVGIGLERLVLIGDVIMTEVVDEDEVKTGHQRVGTYFGMSGFMITLSGMLVSSIFGLIMPAFGYDTLLDVQPDTVELGFRPLIELGLRANDAKIGAEHNMSYAETFRYQTIELPAVFQV